jgi:hypothetical protein
MAKKSDSGFTLNRTPCCDFNYNVVDVYIDAIFETCQNSRLKGGM